MFSAVRQHRQVMVRDHSHSLYLSQYHRTALRQSADLGRGGFIVERAEHYVFYSFTVYWRRKNTAKMPSLPLLHGQLPGVQGEAPSQTDQEQL